MKRSLPSRRQFLQWASGVAMSSGALSLPRTAGAAQQRADAVSFGDDAIQLTFDRRSWVSVAARAPQRRTLLMTAHAGELLTLADGNRVDEFEVLHHSSEAVSGLHGSGSQLTLTGVSTGRVEKTLQLRLYERYPGFVLYRVSYRNLSAGPLKVRSWSNGVSTLQARPGAGPAFWSYSGGSYSD